MSTFVKIFIVILFTVLSGAVGFILGSTFGVWGIPMAFVVGLFFAQMVVTVLESMED